MNKHFYFSGFSLATLGYYYSTLSFSIMDLHCFVLIALLESSTEVCSWPSGVFIFTWLSHCKELSFNSFPTQVSLVLKTTLIFGYIFFLASGLGVLHLTVPTEIILCLTWLPSWDVQHFTPHFPCSQVKQEHLHSLHTT